MKKILLVGRSGNGITSCVKSINNIQNPVQTLAIECSGVGDTGADRTESASSVVKKVRNKIETYGGFDAICFVLKYGVRFTKQERDAVGEVKSMFGQNVFHDHGIIIMTYGDLFESNEEGYDQSFTDWLTKQEGGIREVFQEVRFKVYLFDNKTNNLEEKQRQLEKLNNCFKFLTKTYKIEHFEIAQERQMLNNKSHYVFPSSTDKNQEHFQCLDFVKGNVCKIIIAFFVIAVFCVGLVIILQCGI